MNDLILKIKNSILNGNNIVIHSLKDERLSFFRNEFYKLLESNEYAIFKGTSAFNYHCKINGRTLNFEKFWIEETNTDLLLSIFDDYDYYEVL